MAALPALASEASAQTSRVFDIARSGQGVSGDGTGEPTQGEASLVRAGDESRLGLGDLQTADSLSIAYPWLFHVKLLATDLDEGEVTLGPSVEMRSARYRTETHSTSLAGKFKLEESDCGGHRFYVHRGALALDNWPAGGCHAAAGATLVNGGTTYAVQVDGDGWALLGVTEDSVFIHWWGRDTTESRQTMPCELVDDEPCLQVARVGELWKWSLDESPELANGSDPPPIVPAFDPYWTDMVDFLVDDAWPDPFYKSPYFWGGVVGGGALLCLLWLCPGDDVTGTVIINPTR